MIFRNGAIHPMTGDPDKVEALAIGGGKILAVGSAADVSALARPATTIVDLHGRALFPGFIDPHHHTILSALLGDLLIDVGFAKSPKVADALGLLKARAETTTPGEWIAAGFYDNLLQGGDLSMADLDAISARHPIFVLYVNGHVGAANALAFQRAGIAQDAGMLPGGGHFGRGTDGKLNGLMYEEPALLRFLGVAVPPTTPNSSQRRSRPMPSGRRRPAIRRCTNPAPSSRNGWRRSQALQHARYADERELQHRRRRGQQGLRIAWTGGQGENATRQPVFALWNQVWADGSNQAEMAAQTTPYLNSANKGTANYSVRGWSICAARPGTPDGRS